LATTDGASSKGKQDDGSIYAVKVPSVRVRTKGILGQFVRSMHEEVGKKNIIIEFESVKQNQEA